MKSSLEQKEELFSTTSEDKKLQIRENNYLFNHIDKLAADHDVTVTNTMIKITYKKALKDQNPSDGTVDFPDADFALEKNQPTERVAAAATATLTNSDISIIPKSPKVQGEGSKGPVFHSTPKQSTIITEKKKKYVNGLNLIAKPNYPEEKSSISKVQKLQEDRASSPKKSKAVANKKASKHDFDKKFLKGNGLVKPKASIIHKSHGDPKKTKLSKESDKKVKKLENGTKSKTWIEKKGMKIGGLKRKASNSELNVFARYKKFKISESKGKKVNDESGGGSLEDGDKSVVKRQIMLVDPDLPTGWTRSVKTKNKDSANEQYVVNIVNPQGKKFQNKWKLRKYLQKTNSTLDADQFFFGPYERPKASNSSSSAFEKYENPADAVPESSKGHELRTSPEPKNEKVEPCESSNNEPKSSDGKELLLFDPDLPFGWKRVIHSNAVNGRKQVHIISPDGKIFRRRYRLNEYLIKHQFPHNLDRFYFGLYPKKEGSLSGKLGKESEEKIQNSMKLSEISSNTTDSAMVYNKPKPASKNFDKKININKIKVESNLKLPQSAMYEDPNLPEGWKRFIKIRSYGESAGRMEVVIVSPDGRRHRSKKHLEHYLLQKQLKYKVGDFDFSVFGKSNVKKRAAQLITPKPESKPERETKQEPDSEPCDLSFLSMKKKFTDKPVPELDISSLKDTVITPEGHMINTVNGLMICSDLSSARNERRQRVPRAEHEKQLKNLLSSEGDLPCSGCEIPTFWIQRLVKCRTDLRNLESDAASTIAEFTKEFIKTLSLRALKNSKEPEAGLKYEDMAELVDRTESLSFLKTLIPKKITFREYIKLNRPKQFMSFT